MRFTIRAFQIALQQNYRMHKVSSSLIGAMRQNYGGNWLCNIRNKEDQMGMRFHGRIEGLFVTFKQ